MRVMKNVFAIAALLAVTLFFEPSPALALDPALTLKDGERGTTADLYPTGDNRDKGLLLYSNDRFGYSVKVPHEIFTQVVVLPDNNDGLILRSRDGQYRFRASGGFVVFEDELESSLKNAKQHLEKDGKATQVFAKKGIDWWTLSWWNAQGKGSRKFMANGEVWCEVEITGPALPRNAPGGYDDLLDRALESLALPLPALAPSAGPSGELRTPPMLHKVYQFADLNGNGVMEIVVGADDCNGFSHQVHEIKGGRAALALNGGAGH